MMNAATSKPVVNRIRAAILNPADVCRLQAEVGTIQLDAVSTERAAVSPRGDHSITEGTVPPGGPIDSFQVEASSLADAFMKRLREVSGQNLPADFTDYLRPMA